MGYVNVGSFTFVNPGDTANIQWCAKGTPSSGATLTGGYNFSIGETLRTRLLDQNVAKNRFWNVSVTYFFKAGQIN